MMHIKRTCNLNLIAASILLGIILIGVSSCQSDFHSSSKYLGGSIKIDEGYYLPLNTFLNWSEDSVALVNLTTAEEQRFSMYIDGDTLHVDTLKYPRNTFEFKGDLFKYRKPYTVTLFPPAQVKLALSRIELRNMIQSSSWNTEEAKMTFKEGGTVYIQYNDKTYSEQRCWSLRTYDGLFFLVIHGSLLNCENTGFPTYQIIEAKSDRIKVRYMEADFIQTESWASSSENAIEEVDSFQLCNSNLNLNVPSHHYYYQETSLRGGHYTIKKYLADNFLPRKNGFTGTIRIRFVVNCLGKTGRFETLSLLPDYSVAPSTPPEEASLLDITQKLGPWQPGTYRGAGEVPIDTYIFIAYKLKDGKVVDLLP